MRRLVALGLAVATLTACGFSFSWPEPGDPDGAGNGPGNGDDGDGNDLIDETGLDTDGSDPSPPCRGSAIAVSPDERFVVVRGDGEVVVVDAATDAVVLRLPEADGKVATVYFDGSGHAFLRWTSGRLDRVDLIVGEVTGSVALAWSALAASPSGAFLAPSDAPVVLRTDDLAALEMPLAEGDAWLAAAWQGEVRVVLVERTDVVPALWLLRWAPGAEAVERTPLGPVGEDALDVVAQGITENLPWLDVAPDGRIAFWRIGLDGLPAFGVVDPSGSVLFGPAVDSPVAFVAGGRWMVGWQFFYDADDQDDDDVLFESGLEVFDPADGGSLGFVPTDDALVWPSWAVVGDRWLVVDPEPLFPRVVDLDTGDATTVAGLEGAIEGDFVEVGGGLVFAGDRRLFRWSPGSEPAIASGVEAKHVNALPGRGRLVVDTCTVGTFQWLAADTLAIIGTFSVGP